jgi:CRISPR-associated protein Csm3
MTIRLIKYCRITGTIEVKTGLHIGGSADKVEIGGLDNPIIKHPITGQPYIPGSSLKGKMRSLLEWHLPGKLMHDGNVHSCDDPKCAICRIFGCSAEEGSAGPSRLIVRDAMLATSYLNDMRENGLSLSDILEVKVENQINRITARANPRPLERVPAGVKFDYEMKYRVFDCDNDAGKTDMSLLAYVLEGMRLVEEDALGGAGSRGCGKIAFCVDSSSGKIGIPLSNIKPEDIPCVNID